MARPHLHELIERVRCIRMSTEQQEEQRRSFAYGNTKIANAAILRATVDEVAAEMSCVRTVDGRE